jgi:D-alanyl-D-alanine carboxypeptidase (penicillin-binding protein 5/6)
MGVPGTSGPVGTPQPIASVTKTMTAYLILKDHPITPGENGGTLTVTADEAGQLPEEEALHQSLVPVHAGDHFTEQQALQALDAGLGGQHGPGARPVGLRYGVRVRGADERDCGRPGHDPHQLQPAPGISGLLRLHGDGPDQAGRGGDQGRVLRAAGGRVERHAPRRNDHQLQRAAGEDGVNGIKTGSTYWAGGCLLFSARTTVGGHPVTLVGAALGRPGSITGMLPNAFAATRELIGSTGSALTRTTLWTTTEQVAVDGQGEPLYPADDIALTPGPGSPCG